MTSQVFSDDFSRCDNMSTGDWNEAHNFVIASNKFKPGSERILTLYNNTPCPDIVENQGVSINCDRMDEHDHIVGGIIIHIKRKILL